MHYNKENTRFLSQYGDPASEQLTGEYTTESRPYLLPAGFHVIPVVTGKEKQEYGLPPAKWMKPYYYCSFHLYCWGCESDPTGVI